MEQVAQHQIPDHQEIDTSNQAWSTTVKAILLIWFAGIYLLAINGAYQAEPGQLPTAIILS